MYKLIFFLFVFTSLKLIAQETLNSKIVEQKSYQLYVDKNWKELILFGNKALKNNIDYFYLRERIGIAYFELKNYRAAQRNFQKAYQFNSSEDLILEYLYYCHIYLAQFDEAKKLSKYFSADLKNKIKTGRDFAVNYIYAEGGEKLSNFNKENSSPEYKPYFKPFIYTQLGFGHSLGKNASLFHAFSYLNQNYYQGSFTQMQYYMKVNLPMKNNWSISPAFHYLNTGYAVSYKYDSIEYKYDYSAYIYDSTILQKQRSIPIKYSSCFVSSIAIKKSISNFDVGMSSSYSNIDKKIQIQHGIFGTYFPFGNNKFSFTSAVYLQSQCVETKNSYDTLKFAFSQTISLQPFAKINLLLNYYCNQAKNINEDNGSLVNNSYDLTSSRYTALVSYVIRKRFDIYALYQREYKTNSYNNPTNYYKQEDFKYFYNTGIMGVRMRF